MIGKVLKNSDYRKFIAGQFFSLLGSQVSLIALPVIAIKFLNASATEVGILVSLSYLPFLLFGLPFGTLIDRLKMKPILLTCDLARFFLLTLIPLSFYFNFLSLPLLFAVAFLNGLFTAAFEIAHFSVLPLIVEKKQIGEANEKLGISYNAGEVLGPALGGWVVEILKAPLTIALDSISYLISFFFLYKTDINERPKAHNNSSFFSNIKEGFNFVTSHDYLFPIVLSLCIANFFDLFGILKAILPIYALKVINLSDRDFGYMMAIASVGGFLGPIFNTKVTKALGQKSVFVLTSFIPGLSILCLSTVQIEGGFWSSSLLLALCTFCSSIFNINQITLRQTLTPARLLGRMNATVRFFIWGSIPLGALIGGHLADYFGIRTTMILAGLGTLTSVIPFLLSPAFKNRKKTAVLST